MLEKYDGGVDNFVCCQNYVGKTCCVEPATYCKGSMLGLVLEGCCCPMFSLSIARMHLMDKKRVQPDPCDWQIIQCSNCLQLISCVLDLVAMMVPQAQDLAELVGIIVDLFTMSVGGCMGAQVTLTLTLTLPLTPAITVGGCMGAQVYHEINLDVNGVVNHPVVLGVPINGSPPNQEIER